MNEERDNIVKSLKDRQICVVKFYVHSTGSLILIKGVHETLVRGLAYSSFFSSPAKTTLSGQGYGFCWWRR